MTFNDIILRKG